MNNKKSLELNMVLNSLRGILRIVFPLITFPYTSKVLGVYNIGRYNFSASVIGYFVLLAGLGISAYAVREGAKIRDDRAAFNSFANEMFSFNVISSIIAYAVLLLCCMLFTKVQSYKDIILILSLNIAFSVIGMEWVYTVYEDFMYITVRSIAVQLLSLVFLFCFVKDRTDVINYTFVMLFSGVGANLFNFLKLRKYCRLRFTWHIDWHRHFRPVMILFATAVAVVIYANSDITVLGLLCGDYEVGIYSVSAKIYEVVKTILSSVIVVSIPRLVAFLGKNERAEFERTAGDIYKLLLSLVIPALLGIILLRREIVLFVSDMEYIKAADSLMILSFALLMSLGGWFYGQCILVPMNRESVVFKATVISAVVNLGLNFILIPYFREMAAAFTTFIAEFIQFAICAVYAGRYLNIKGLKKHILKIVLGCLPMLAADYFIGLMNMGNMMHIVAVMLVSVIMYFAVEMAVGNASVVNLPGKLRKGYGR